MDTEGMIRRPVRWRRGAVGVGLVVVIAVVVGLVVGLSGSRASRGGGQAGTACACAGYRSPGRVTSVSADWKIPTVLAGTVGFASIWIGVQADGDSGRFIQLGINEGRQITAAEAKLGVPNRDFPIFAYAYWSDTAHQFHPVYIGSVAAGDIVHASMTLVRGGWLLRFVDRHSLLSVHVTTDQEGSEPLPWAEWSLEDVRDDRANRLFPFPRLSAVGFQAPRVNGAPPTSGQLSAVRMSLSPKITFVPTPFDGDAFGIVRAT
jgi:hypothetical protein